MAISGHLLKYALGGGGCNLNIIVFILDILFSFIQKAG